MGSHLLPHPVLRGLPLSLSPELFLARFFLCFGLGYPYVLVGLAELLQVREEVLMGLHPLVAPRQVLGLQLRAEAFEHFAFCWCDTVVWVDDG